ncbi:MYG1 family protein [Candidatus Parcubacteria bacterium]|nr:MYG1 family protein [Candidatus Parcubacteria bacterium]
MSKTIATHSGMFHADDVFAVATLLLMYPDANVVRTRDEEKIRSAEIAVDVGGEYDPAKMLFDHHQQGGAGVRGNAIPYASFGLVWKQFGEQLAGPEAKQLIEEKLVMPIDAHDNGVSIYTPMFDRIKPYTITDFFYSFMSYEEEGEEYLMEVFLKNVGIAKELLKREIDKSRDKIDGMEKVRKIVDAAADKRIIILDEVLPWEQILSLTPESIFVVYPRREGNWGAKGVPLNSIGFERRKLFPENWAGKTGGELAEITGVSDAVFVHRGRFMAVAKSKEGALELAKIALNA